MGAKNLTAIIDILGCFDVGHIYDPFAGSGTTGLAALELNMDCTLTEKDEVYFNQLTQQFNFFS